ncbi:rhodanese-like domain-containing protein [Mechercharimyces sp. CAU 1602]|uniref:rhodanese-like domain-containing protein n=1 Tax=Mechercharimyces sp. CAU 1602 TaxID=2973933 RepID=UPI00216142BB|nr:rhodanese-like domain-containing protein [Mechercharimyces sp. CAU 1602]MCS1350952.1 rhodanese-like domain-containing protein [Mechercharimyces sp. CAU 1602]
MVQCRQERGTKGEHMEEISARAFAQRYREDQWRGVQLIDVRELHEWEAYHLPEADLIPLQTLPQESGRLQREEPVYLLCAHGVRSEYAARYLKGMGFSKVINVEGGLSKVLVFLENPNYTEKR